MAEPDFGDISHLAARDKDVSTLIHAVKTILRKYGAFLTVRVVASVLAAYKRRTFVLFVLILFVFSSAYRFWDTLGVPTGSALW